MVKNSEGYIALRTAGGFCDFAQNDSLRSHVRVHATFGLWENPSVQTREYSNGICFFRRFAWLQRSFPRFDGAMLFHGLRSSSGRGILYDQHGRTSRRYTLIDRIEHPRQAFRRTFATHPAVMNAVVVLSNHLRCAANVFPLAVPGRL